MKNLLRALAAAALVCGNLHAEPARILGTEDVRDCALASDGAVLAATGGGLVVFDSARRVRVLTALEGLPDTRVESVRVEGEHAEVQTRAGAARVNLRDLRVEPVAELGPRAAFAAKDPFNARAEHALAGRRCVATQHGLLVDSGSGHLEHAPLAGLPTSDISAVARDDARLFVGTFDRGLFVVSGDAIERVDFGVNPNINALAWDATAQALWVGTARGASRCEAALGRPLACRRVGQSVAVHALLVTRGGSIVAGGEQGVSVFGRGGRTERELGAKQRAPFRAVWALSESEQGVLYVGTTNGLFFTKTSALQRQPLDGAPPFQRISFVSGELPDDWVTALATTADRLAVGTYNAGLSMFREVGAKLESADFDTSLGYVNPAGLALLSDGRIAVATMDGLRVGTPGQFRTVPTLGRDVTGVLPTSSGEYWIASRRGLERRALP